MPNFNNLIMKKLIEIIKKILSKLLPTKKLIFNDLTRNKPVSSYFGTDRGMPIDRYYIEKFLHENSKLIRGSVLEIAESHYSKKYATNVTSFEVLHIDKNNKNATIIGDLSNHETLPADKVDCFICTQTLNFIFDVSKAVAGSYILLKEGGYFLGTVAGISQISRYDMDRWGDYWRFTSLSIKKIFDQIYGENNVEIFVYGNVLSSVAFLQGLAIEDLPDISLLHKNDPDYQMLICIKARKTKKV